MQLPFIICQLYKALATHAIGYRKEEGHGLALIVVEMPEVAPAKSASGGLSGYHTRSKILIFYRRN